MIWKAGIWKKILYVFHLSDFTIPHQTVFKCLKPLSFRGLRPLDPRQGRCPWNPGPFTLRSLRSNFFSTPTSKNVPRALVGMLLGLRFLGILVSTYGPGPYWTINNLEGFWRFFLTRGYHWKSLHFKCDPGAYLKILSDYGPEPLSQGKNR